MSFQLATATALPAEVQLGRERPQGAFALRSRYALSANTANSWNAGTTLSVPLQTGTPGTFTDVKQGCIHATIQITNTNPYVDFLNFGPCGALIFFDEMRVYSSGTAIEENLKYSETADLLMMQGGRQSKPFSVYRRNQWRANNGRAGDRHINFIKPSMVDSQGCPMFGNTPFMDKNSAVYQPAAVAFGVNMATRGASSGQEYETMGLSSIAVVADTAVISFGQIVGTDCGAPFNDASITLYDTVFGSTQSMGSSAMYDYVSGAGETTLALLQHRTASHVLPSAAGRTSIAPNDPYAFKNTQLGRSAPLPTQIASGAWLPAASYVPSQWPDFQPCSLCGEVDDDEVDIFIGKQKPGEYMKYLCNVRNLPIGVQGKSADNPFSATLGSNYQRNTSALLPQSISSVNNAGTRYLEYRVSMPFLSGIYGIFADKMFPDMLIGANNMRIEFKLAQVGKALWTTMDPCRRVLGTARDFVPFTGSASGKARTSSALSRSNIYGQHQNAVSTTIYDGMAKFAGTYSTDHWIETGAALGCANSAVYVNSGLHAGNITPWSEMYNTASAMGEDLVGSQPAIKMTQPTVISILDTAGAGFTYRSGPQPYIGMPVNTSSTTGPTTAGFVATYTPGVAGTGTGSLSAGTYTIGTITCVNSATAFNRAGINQGFHLSPFSNLPKPQYVPVGSPWICKEDTSSTSGLVSTQNLQGLSPTYVNESQACFGTYLPSAVAQSRRCWQTSRLMSGSTGPAVGGDAFNNAGSIQFQVKDIQYIGEQVQLDDVVSSAIIQSAATSEIVVWSRAYRAFEASCDNSTAQNIILPIQVGQAEGMYLIFRPNAILTSPDYYSNSFYCPFVGLSFAQTSNNSHVGGQYTLNSSLDSGSSGQFSYQLFSGTKQYPLQPVQTVAELLAEKEKATHSLHNWEWAPTENFGIVQWGRRFGPGASTSYDFDPFQDFGFFTTFVPLVALDDQTITQNPYFVLAETNESNIGLLPNGLANATGLGGQTTDAGVRIRGYREPAIPSSADKVYTGVLNKFTPPIGAFYLGWDFESWTNHQDVMRTGKFLGQEQLTVRMTGTYLMAATNPLAYGGTAQVASIICHAIVPHVIKLSFVPGGHLLTYY